MTAINHEAYVRSRWKHVSIWKDEEYDPAVYRICIRLHEGDESSWIAASGSTPDLAWAAAYGATVERCTDIRQREYDWKLLEDFINSEGGTYQKKLFVRLYAREQATLAELKRGLKTEGEQG